jgi:3-oxoacyl-[acyl-carrier protein] reductase
MANKPVILITGSRKGIGRYLVTHYLERGFQVIGCSRAPADPHSDSYRHFCLDVASESEVKVMFQDIRKEYGRLDILVNNAGIASMNHSLLTPIPTAERILRTNVIGTFLCSREAVKLMMKAKSGRIVNFVTLAIPFKLEGEAIYAASKAAVVTLTEVLSREYADFGVTVNAVGPPAVQTDLIRGVPKDTMDKLLQRQAIHRFGDPQEICNVIDFFIQPQSSMVTGQVVYLGGV